MAASIIWYDRNYLNIQESAASIGNATVTADSITFTGEGQVDCMLQFSYDGTTGDILSTPNMKLHMVITCDDLSELMYRSDLIAIIRVYYWKKTEDDTYASTPFAVYSAVPSPSESAGTFEYDFIHELDESSRVSQLDVSFICSEYHNQVISEITLERAESLKDEIAKQIEAAQQGNVLTAMDFYTDGFVATYSDSALTYRYLVENDELIGFVHQPSGTIIRITEHSGVIP